MKLRHVNLAGCGDADGVVVVVDVLRAFTTAAYAFDRGAEEILLVSTVEQAFELRENDPEYLLMGEVAGLPIDGFDLPNSPSTIADLDLSARRLIQRTTAGTQGVVRSTGAGRLYAASLCVASATADIIRKFNPEAVTFVNTGVKAKGGGDEDAACSDYIGSLLLENPVDSVSVRSRVLDSRAAAKFMNAGHTDFPRADLECALQIDRFSFSMAVERRGDLFVLQAIR